jgi:hypothetical protein
MHRCKRIKLLTYKVNPFIESVQVAGIPRQLSPLCEIKWCEQCVAQFKVSLSNADDVNLEEATITVTNANIDGDTLGLGGLLPAGLTFTTKVDVGKIELRITGSASLRPTISQL